jgi:hypothetical protein
MNKRNIVTTIPLLIVNTIAVTGQFIFWRSHLPTFPAIAALGFACALESIAVFVAYHAHLAELSHDSSFRLRFGSYAAGLIIGLLNGSHFTAGGRITAASVGMFILSAASPVLWAIHTRRQSRDDLKSQGLIEDRAVKLGAMRWILWPAQAFPVFRLAVWRGENRPDAAIADWEESRAQAERNEPAAIPVATAVTLATARTKADAVRAALAELGADLTARAVAEWLAERGWTVTPAHVRAVRAQAIRAGNAPLYALPGPDESEPQTADQ